MRKSDISYAEAATVSTICFGLFIYWSLQAVADGFPMARFSDASSLWSIVIELVLASAALLYLYARRFDIASLYPQPSLRGSLVGVGLFFASWGIGLVAVLPFYTASEPHQAEFSFRGASLAFTIVFAMVNGAFEEVFLLGVLVRGLRHQGLSMAIGLPLLVRILYHLYQGPIGVIWILAFGATFTLVYLHSRKLWPPVLAHVLWDIVPFIFSEA